MGFFSQWKRSKEKTRLMTELIDALKNPRDVATIDTKARQFYDYISAVYILGPIITQYNANYEIIKDLILRLNEAVGGHYGGWHKSQYIPVSTFAFSKSLECALKEYHNGSSIELILFEVQKLM